MENYCVNCKWFDDIGRCHKRGDAIDPVYGTRRYAYRDGDSDSSSYAEDAGSVRKSHCKGDWFEPSRWARFKEWAKGLLWRNVTFKVCEDDATDEKEFSDANAIAREILEVLNNGVENDEKSSQITFCFRDGEWMARVFSPHLDELITADHAGSIEEAGKELLELCRMLMEAKK